MSHDLSSIKETIRSQMKGLLSHLTFSEVKELSLKVQSQIVCSDLFRNSKSIAVYHPYKNEVQTDLLFEESKKNGKQIAYPKVVEDDHPLQFFWIDSLSELTPGRFGFFEPNPALSLKTAELFSIHLMIVPGLAFDLHGYRVGRGKGFYDRTLKEFKGRRLGVAYSFQLCEEVPHEIWDETIDYLATENELMGLS